MHEQKQSNRHILTMMGIGLSIAGTAGFHQTPRTHFETKVSKNQPAWMAFAKQPLALAHFQAPIFTLEINSAVRELLAEFHDVSAFLLETDEWIDNLYYRVALAEDFSNSIPGITVSKLTPVRDGCLRNNESRFKIKGTNQWVFRLSLVLGNGQSVERCLVAEENHQKELVLVEVLPPARILATPGALVYCREVKVMEATAYYPGPECTGYSCDGLTSTGKKAGYGIVAVDPQIIPLGTRLYIQGYGFAEAADVGGAIKGMRIDLCFNTYREALVFGRKRVKVFILD